MTDQDLTQKFLAQRETDNSADQWMRDLVGGQGGGTGGSSAGIGSNGEKGGLAPSPSSSSGGSAGGVGGSSSAGGGPEPVDDAPPSPHPLTRTVEMIGRGSWAVAKDVGEGIFMEGVPAIYDGAKEAVKQGNRTAGLFFDWAYKNWTKLQGELLNVAADVTGTDRAEARAQYDAAWSPFGEVNKLFKAKYGRDMVPSDFNLIGPVVNALPDPEQETWTGSIISGLSQYLTGNAIMGPLATATKIPVNIWGQAVRDSLNGAVFFDERMERLSNLLPEGPVRDFMIADPAGEETALNKLKMAMEGGVVGLGAGATFETVKWALRTWKAAVAHVPPPKLVVSRLMPDGSIREGKPGDLHPMLVDEGEDFNAATNESMGFTIPGSGKHMTRAEALEWIKKNEPGIYAAGEKRGITETGGRTGFRYVEAGKYQEIRVRIERMKELVAAGWKKKDAAEEAGIPGLAEPPREGAALEPTENLGDPDVKPWFKPAEARPAQIYMLEGKELSANEILKLTDEEVDRLEIFEHDGTRGVTSEDAPAPELTGKPEGFEDRPDSPLFTQEQLEAGETVPVLDDSGGGAQEPRAGGGGGNGHIPPEEPSSAPEGAPDEPAQASLELRDYLQLAGGEDDLYVGLLNDRPQVVKEAVSQLKRQLAREANTPGEMVPISGRSLKINLDKLETTEDVKLLLADMEHMMDLNDIPMSDVTKRALELHTGVKDYLNGNVDPVLYGPAHQLRMRILLTASGENLLDMAKKAYSLSGTLIDKAKFVKAFTIHRNLQEFALTQQVGIERAFGTFKIMAKSDGEALTQIRELMNNLGEANIDEIIEKMAQLDDPTKASMFAREVSKADSRDYINMVWYNLLLSSPDTLMANLIGTGGNILWQIPERFLGAVVAKSPLHKPSQLGDPLAKNMGDEKVFLEEPMALLYGYIKGHQNAFRMATKALKTGRPTFDANSPITEGIRIAPGTINPNAPVSAAAQWLNTMIPTNWMRGADDYFKWVNFNGELNALALRHAMTMGKDEAWAQDLLRHPPAWMLQAAKKKSLEATFNSPLTGWIRSFATTVDQWNIPVPHMPQHKIPAGRILMPFIRTPTNIMKWTYDRTLAALWPNSRIRNELRAGGATRDMAIAKMASGSLLTASFGAAMLSGNIDGAGPKDPVMNSTWRRAGHEPYTIRIGDTRVKFDRFQPIADILRLMADGTEIMQFADDANQDYVAQSVVFAVAEALTNKTYFQALGEFFKAMDDSQYEGTKWTNRMASSLVPAGAKDLERMMDPTVRQSRSALDAIKAGIPYYSETLEPNLDVWGREMKQVGFDALLLNIFPSGARDVSDEKVYPVDKWLWDHRIGIEKVNRVQQWERSGITVKKTLTPKELNQLVRIGSLEIQDPETGLNLVDTLNLLVEGKLNSSTQEVFDRASDHFKGLIIKKLVQKFRDAAKDQFIEANQLEGALEESFNRKAQELAPEIVGGQ